jgi:hypothetical protein
MLSLPLRPRGLMLLGSLALAALACGSLGAEPTATPFAKPTKAPQLTPTEEVVVEPTSAPTSKPTKTPVSQVAFTVADQAYEHSSGAFAIQLPQDWKVEEFNASVSANDPDGVGFIEVTFVNVGQEFSADQLTAYAQAVEENWFATFDNYESNEPETLESGTLLVFKTLELDGASKTVYSYYWQEGTVIYAENFWADSDHYNAYADGYGDVSSSTQTDPGAGAEADLYDLRYEFVGPEKLFAFSVPYGWTHTTSTEDVATLDSFNSPDDITYIETIIYDDGTEISQSLAGRFALTLLKEFYDFSDVRVSADEPLADGREKLTWSSKASGVDGSSYFESRDTTFIMLTWIVEQDATAFYLPLWEVVADSYYVP